MASIFITRNAMAAMFITRTTVFRCYTKSSSLSLRFSHRPSSRIVFASASNNYSDWRNAAEGPGERSRSDNWSYDGTKARREAEESAERARETMKEGVDRAKEGAQEMKERTKEYTHEAKEKTKEGAEDAQDAAARMAETTKNAADRSGETLRNVGEKAKETVQGAWEATKDTTKKIKDTVVGKNYDDDDDDDEEARGVLGDDIADLKRKEDRKNKGYSDT
ncbi:uncharacterized protein ECU03_1610-like [Arachis stenosperma]|uniref:uncharacterized protein ECU03_1610-like n=1 Tax=Arachis stenosperma TaxID=217475 RepID=UPI0025AB89B6|nr:uncharacterized protein ECU03_1610-like [Arachis stenosperma]